MGHIDNILSMTELMQFHNLWMPIGFKVMVAIMCGGLIGLEREMKHKPAGLRTNILICLGACLFTMLSVLIADPLHNNDPGRIAAQVVGAIGFLGGGMIIQSSGGVTGLTSAATVWVVAAIGMCIGLGYPIVASIFTVTVFFTLYVLSTVDRKVFGKLQNYESTITLANKDTAARAQVMDVFNSADLELRRLLVVENEKGCQVISKYVCSEARHLRVQAALWSVSLVTEVDEKRLG
jgi:uncharacterized membrane protein YhiD involved in acid resistance